MSSPGDFSEIDTNRDFLSSSESASIRPRSATYLHRLGEKLGILPETTVRLADIEHDIRKSQQAISEFHEETLEFAKMFGQWSSQFGSDLSPRANYCSSVLTSSAAKCQNIVDHHASSAISAVQELQELERDSEKMNQSVHRSTKRLQRAKSRNYGPEVIQKLDSDLKRQANSSSAAHGKFIKKASDAIPSSLGMLVKESMMLMNDLTSDFSEAIRFLDSYIAAADEDEEEFNAEASSVYPTDPPSETDHD